LPLPIEQGLGLKAPRRGTLEKFRARIEAEQVLADELETVIKIESGDRHVFELSFTPPAALVRLAIARASSATPKLVHGRPIRERPD